jgi:protein-tyrosine phosphatase
VIDLHNHILFEIDDGPKTLKGSLKMARLLSECGYRYIVATPHMVPGTSWIPSIMSIKNRIEALNHAATAEGQDLKILPGMEISFDLQLLDLLKDNKVLTLGGKLSTCLLIEPPFQNLPMGWEQIIFKILSSNFQILLAHPERCEQLMRNPQMIDQLIHAGIHIQVNWKSFLGEYGRFVQKAVQHLAEKDQIHCLATDAHAPRDCKISAIRSAARVVQQMVGRKKFFRMAQENPLRLLQGKSPLPMSASAAADEYRKEPLFHIQP